jgi:hypothetical protein
MAILIMQILIMFLRGGFFRPKVTDSVGRFISVFYIGAGAAGAGCVVRAVWADKSPSKAVSSSLV